MEPHQGRFSAAIGVSQNRQSLFENGTRDLKADYLEKLDKVGIDIHYVVTGKRIGTDTFDSKTSRIITALQKLPEDRRDIVGDLAEALVASNDQEGNSTIHDPPAPYAPEGDGD